MLLRASIQLALSLCLVPVSAKSAVLIIEDGKLTGATGVMVGDDIYNVDFVDGTCFDLFSGCDEGADFTFSWMDPDTFQAAQAALYDQVFLGVYDTQPELTEGCTNVDACEVFFPIQKLPPPDAVGFATTNNAPDADPDTETGTGSGVFRFQDYGLIDYRTYAVWDGPFSPPVVPIPPLALAGVGAGLLGLGSRRLRQRGRG